MLYIHCTYTVVHMWPPLRGQTDCGYTQSALCKDANALWTSQLKWPVDHECIASPKVKACRQPLSHSFWCQTELGNLHPNPTVNLCSVTISDKPEYCCQVKNKKLGCSLMSEMWSTLLLIPVCWPVYFFAGNSYYSSRRQPCVPSDSWEPVQPPTQMPSPPLH